MKRALLFILIVVAVVAGFLSIRGALPFMPIAGDSMEPQLNAGDLIFFDEVLPSQIKEGDVIVYTVPPLVREAYNYPATIAHRVIKVEDTRNGTFFRTKGDNVDGEDPFTVRPRDIRGVVGKRISYLGFPLLFFQSKHGLIFIIIALVLFGVFLFTDELSHGWRTFQRGVFAPVIEENQRSSRALEKKIEMTEERVAGTQQALQSFAAAIAEYAQHLKSHTSAIQGLAEASQELRKISVEQNRILVNLVQRMEQIPKPVESQPHVATKAGLEEALREQNRTLTILIGKLESREKVAVKTVHEVTPQPIVVARQETLSPPAKSPPGCYFSRRKSTGGGKAV